MNERDWLGAYKAKGNTQEKEKVGGRITKPLNSHEHHKPHVFLLLVLEVMALLAECYKLLFKSCCQLKAFFLSKTTLQVYSPEVT